MELVYLWVEDYKNIQKQGFNFSPRFECKFHDEYEQYIDEEGEEQERLKDDCKLEIIEKKEDEYIKDFFGENINVTAIVGKNGSGKSGLVSILDDINILKKKNIKNILIISLDGSLYFLSTLSITTELEKFNSSFEYMSYNAENPYPYLEREEYHLYHDIEVEDEFDIYMNNDEVSDYDSRYIEISNSKDNVITFNKRQLLLKNIHKSMLDIKVTSFMLVPYKFTIINFNNMALYKYVEEKLRDKDFDNLGFSFKLNDVKEYFTESTSTYDLVLLDFFVEKKVFLDFIAEVKNHYGVNEDLLLLEFFEYVDTYYTNHKVELGNSAEELNSILWDGEFIISETSIEVKNKLFIEYSDFIILDYEDIKKRKFSDLSHGEKSIYALMLNIQYKIKNSEDNNLIFCLDEPDLSLHPEWQRKFLYEFIINIITEDKYIHFILTTHSPFLLSDVLKENIIFLDKDENGNCKVVDGLKEKKQTFGANIHTLLSDSFFMEDGLMGEFAKSKIDKAIRLLNKDTLDEKELKYCEQIISIIGEPIVKNQLQRMLTDKKISYLAKDTREEIEFLKHRIDLLSKRL